ncbi:hypothetical protein [Stieleria mannarensis]|uniref:hypothetical protein n=1 Tax=Stieleria mannarensis TaxID=2755585 RepID=UPI001602B664|nr:hypothetical protein [Rhodopirellula sp. JC639]
MNFNDSQIFTVIHNLSRSEGRIEYADRECRLSLRMKHFDQIYPAIDRLLLITSEGLGATRDIGDERKTICDLTIKPRTEGRPRNNDG